jgi:hypothetical protein
MVEPMYAIRMRPGKTGITYRVTFTRHDGTPTALFRESEYGSAKAALKAAQAWRDQMVQVLMPETKQAFSQRVKANNTSGCPGVYLKRQTVRRGDRTGEYTFWQAQTPEGVKPFRSRSFSVNRYGFDGAYELAVQARAEFVTQGRGFIGVAPIPERFRPHKR